MTRQIACEDHDFTAVADRIEHAARGAVAEWSDAAVGAVTLDARYTSP